MTRDKRSDYTGRTFGEVTVMYNIIPSNGINKGGIWKCQCSCGVEFEYSGYGLHSHRSCGHLARENALDKSAKNRRPERMTLTGSYTDHKNAAKNKRNTPLSRENWYKIAKSPCYYCGEIDVRNRATAPYYSRKCKLLTLEIIKSYEVNINGIDRIDNTLGYIKGNMVPCCSRCNKMKSNLTKMDFLNKITKIYNHLKL